MKKLVAIYKVGDPVFYRDAKGDWAKGSIHGVQQAENREGFIISINYLVNTGGVFHEDVKMSDRNGRRLGILYNEEIKKRGVGLETVEDVRERSAISRKIIKDNPELAKPDLYEHKIVQPEQILVSAEQLKPRK